MRCKDTTKANRVWNKFKQKTNSTAIVVEWFVVPLSPEVGVTGEKTNASTTCPIVNWCWRRQQAVAAQTALLLEPQSSADTRRDIEFWACEMIFCSIMMFVSRYVSEIKDGKCRPMDTPFHRLRKLTQYKHSIKHMRPHSSKLQF